MAITAVPIRATIEMGNTTVKTPYILSFNVTKTRNQKSTFQASVKVKGDKVANIDADDIVIHAGERGNEKKIFTGFILKANPSPCWEDPTYVVLNISGADCLHKLEHEKYTRRQIGSKNKWAIINSVVTKFDKGDQFKLGNEPMVKTTDGDFRSVDEKIGATFGQDAKGLSSTGSIKSANEVFITADVQYETGTDEGGDQ